jgi:cyclase
VAIIRTRVADDTWVFTSELYLEVNAGLVVTEEGGILIDTLPFPSETKQIIDFANRVCPQGIRYVINTVAHADHVYGSYLLPDAELVAHEHCRELLQKYAFASLEEAKEHTPELRAVEVRLPKLVFNTPGPSPEVCVVHVREDKVLFASDLMMPVPIIASPFSDIEQYKRSLANLHDYNLESIVQGHGDILLRGEVTSSINASVKYLNDIQNIVESLMDRGGTKHDLLQNDVEQFGRSRIPLGGLVQQFHNSNLLHLWEKARLRRRQERIAQREAVQ